jgi:NADH-quinone oxidoreductase subunit L
MLVVTALTALYSVRVVMMVFFGSAAHARHAHDAGPAMRAALGPLALGVCSTWLLAGPFSRMLAGTLPRHALHAVSTAEMLAEVLSAPATAAALAVTGLGLVLWWQRGRLRVVRAGTAPLTAAARADFGFELANRSLVRTALSAATALSATQTGSLNWNVVGILAALCAVLAALVLVP